MRRPSIYFVSFIFLLCSLLLLPCHAKADEVTLAWDPNSEVDLAGYRLYIQEDDDDSGYRLLIDIALSDIDPQAPDFTVFDLMADTQYRFVITAYNYSGDESGLSNAVCVVNGQQCAASSSGGCFLGVLNTPFVWKTPAPVH